VTESDFAKRTNKPEQERIQLGQPVLPKLETHPWQVAVFSPSSQRSQALLHCARFTASRILCLHSMTAFRGLQWFRRKFRRRKRIIARIETYETKEADLDSSPSQSLSGLL